MARGQRFPPRHACLVLAALLAACLVCTCRAATMPDAAPRRGRTRVVAPVFAAVYESMECDIAALGAAATLVPLSDTGGQCGTTVPTADAATKQVWYRASRAGAGKWNVSLHCDSSCSDCAITRLVAKEGQCVSQGLRKSVQLVTCPECVGISSNFAPTPSTRARAANAPAATWLGAVSRAAHYVSNVVARITGTDSHAAAAATVSPGCCLLRRHVQRLTRPCRCRVPPRPRSPRRRRLCACWCSTTPPRAGTAEPGRLLWSTSAQSVHACSPRRSAGWASAPTPAPVICPSSLGARPARVLWAAHSTQQG